MAGSARGAPGPHVAAGTATWRPAGPKTRPFRFGEEALDGDDPPLAAGVIVGDRYRIVRFLGQGGMGQVYEAEHVHLPRRVALKLLRPDRHTAEHLARFRQEARAASRIGHPSIVDVIDFAQLPDGGVYLAMELLRGESFEDWLGKRGRLGDALRWLAEIARGLDAAHRAGVVHRDIKPQNLFLHDGPDGVEPKILDFGIAKLTGGSWIVSDLRSGTPAQTEHTRIETQAGTVLGTPYYLAPERVLGKDLRPAADLYGLGVILYEVLTGTVPFMQETFMGVLAAHVQVQPLDPRQAAPDRAIPDGVALLTMQLLAKDPAARPPSGAAVAEQLEALLVSENSAIAAVQTGPREQSTNADQQTVHLDAQAARPTTAPDEALGSPVCAPSAVTQAVGPMLAFSDGRAIRTTFETRPPTRDQRRARKSGWVWFASGVAVVSVLAVVGWGLLDARAGRESGAKKASVAAPAPVAPSQTGTADASAPPEPSGPANPPPEGGTNGSVEREVDESEHAMRPRDASPPEPKPDPEPEKKRPPTSRPRPKPSPAPATQEAKQAVPAFKDDVYKD